jgi:hypothetical protein
MRLNQKEQIHMMELARKNPGPLADWLARVVQKQQEVGVNATFDLTEIPVPVTESEERRGASQAFRDSKADREAFYETIGYKEMPIEQRRAIRKLADSVIREINESDLLPNELQCYIGNHEVDYWKNTDEDFFLWQVLGQWTSGKELKKWGCMECGLAIAKAHPEATVNRNG